MTNQPSELTTTTQNNDLVIQTIDGQSITLPQGANVMDITPRQGMGDFQKIGVLFGGQPADSRAGGIFAGAPGVTGREPRFGVSINTKKSDGTFVQEFLGPIEGPITVVPIAIPDSALRGYFKDPYNQNNPAKQPDCRSENYMEPDAKYKGQIIPGTDLVANYCAVIKPRMDRRGNQMHDESGNPLWLTQDVCPLAIGHKDKSDKWVPSACTEQWKMYVAVSIGDELVLAEIYFKSTSRTEGKKVILALNDLKRQGLPLWSKEVELTIAGFGNGNSVMPRFTDAREWDDDTIEGFKNLEATCNQAIAYRAKQAKALPESTDTTANDTSNVIEQNADGTPVNKSNKKKEAMI